MGRRHKLEVIFEILSLAQGGVKKTRLVYLTNINFSMLGRYLNVLFSMGLIEDKGKMLATTPKGVQFVEEYDEFMSKWNIYEEFEKSKKKLARDITT
jgi:predicted transcriptional regulator